MNEDHRLDLPVVFMTSFAARLRGLLFRPPPPEGQGAWISPCRQVHTLGMSYEIDVVFLDRHFEIIALQSVRPWRFSRYYAQATGVVELRSGEAERLGLKTGMSLNLIQTPQHAS